MLPEVVEVDLRLLQLLPGVLQRFLYFLVGCLQLNVLYFQFRNFLVHDRRR